MPARSDLVDYIKKASNLGYSNDEIRKILKENRWNDEEIQDAFNEVFPKKIVPPISPVAPVMQKPEQPIMKIQPSYSPSDTIKTPYTYPVDKPSHTASEPRETAQPVGGAGIAVQTWGGTGIGKILLIIVAAGVGLAAIFLIFNFLISGIGSIGGEKSVLYGIPKSANGLIYVNYNKIPKSSLDGTYTGEKIDEVLVNLGASPEEIAFMTEEYVGVNGLNYVGYSYTYRTKSTEQEESFGIIMKMKDSVSIENIKAGMKEGEEEETKTKYYCNSTLCVAASGKVAFEASDSKIIKKMIISYKKEKVDTIFDSKKFSELLGIKQPDLVVFIKPKSDTGDLFKSSYDDKYSVDSVLLEGKTISKGLNLTLKIECSGSGCRGAIEEILKAGDLEKKSSSDYLTGTTYSYLIPDEVFAVAKILDFDENEGLLIGKGNIGVEDFTDALNEISSKRKEKFQSMADTYCSNGESSLYSYPSTYCLSYAMPYSVYHPEFCKEIENESLTDLCIGYSLLLSGEKEQYVLEQCEKNAKDAGSCFGQYVAVLAGKRLGYSPTAKKVEEYIAKCGNLSKGKETCRKELFAKLGTLKLCSDFADENIAGECLENALVLSYDSAYCTYFKTADLRDKCNMKIVESQMKSSYASQSIQSLEQTCAGISNAEIRGECMNLLNSTIRITAWKFYGNSSGDGRAEITIKNNMNIKVRLDVSYGIFFNNVDYYAYDYCYFKGYGRDIEVYDEANKKLPISSYYVDMDAGKKVRIIGSIGAKYASTYSKEPVCTGKAGESYNYKATVEVSDSSTSSYYGSKYEIIEELDGTYK